MKNFFNNENNKWVLLGSLMLLLIINLLLLFIIKDLYYAMFELREYSDTMQDKLREANNYKQIIKEQLEESSHTSNKSHIKNVGIGGIVIFLAVIYFMNR